MNALVLVVDAVGARRDFLSALCRASGHRVVEAGDAHTGLEVVGREKPDLVMIELESAALRGLDLLRLLKSDPRAARIAVIAAAPEGDDAGRASALESGADELVALPYRAYEIELRIRNTIWRFGAQGRSPNARDVTRGREVDRRAMGDASALHAALQYEFTRAVRYAHALTCVAMADAALRSDEARSALTELLRGCLRGADMVFTRERDELIVLLPETTVVGARALIQRLMSRARDAGIEAPTIGVAAFPDLPVQRGSALLSTALERAAGRDANPPEILGKGEGA